MQQKSSKRGFSLVETLVALSILLVSITAPLTIASKSLQNIYFAREQYTATMLAQEGVEIIVYLHRNAMLETVKNGADGWDDFISELSSNSCMTGSGCAININDSPLTYTNDTNLYYRDSGNPRARYTHDGSAGNPEDTPYSRSIIVSDIGAGHPQVMVESTVTWTSAAVPGTQEVIARTTLADITATSTTP